jgi:predicted RNA-binding Zn-ribbon protein involved in translation (DUF1610 family)
MTTTDTTRRHLDAAAAELRSELERIMRSLELVQAAIDLTTVVVDEPAAVKLDVVSTPAVEPCPACGKVCASNAGRAMHVKHCDKPRKIITSNVTPSSVDEKPETTAEVAHPAPAGAEVYECTECLFRTPSISRLARHCRVEHARDIAQIERSPIAA